MINKKSRIIESLGAVAAVITIACTIASIVFSYYHRDEVPSNLDEFLVKITHYYTIMKTDAILSMICGFFLILVAIGLFFFLRRKLNDTRKKFALIPLISIIFGSLLMISISALQIYLVFYITPNYVGQTFTIQQYYLAKASNVIAISDIFTALTHVITFTIGAGSIGILLYNKKIILDVFVWTALASAVLSLAKIGYFATGTAGVTLEFLASIGSIFFFFFLLEMVYALFKDHQSENDDGNKTNIDTSLLE